MDSPGPARKEYPPLERKPQHVGIIMDGNGRWARERGLPRIAGHRAGTDNLRRVLQAAVDFGIPILTIYAFSTENWGRPEDEVLSLMSIFDHAIDSELSRMHGEGVQVRHLGRTDRIPPRLLEKIRQAVESTANNRKLILNVAFNYGSRAEIVDAIRGIVAAGVAVEDIGEQLVSQYLYTADLPDPDLIIRTSGEMRVSNFLLWQGAYAEYYVTPVYWPDFGKEDLYLALQDFGKRKRRMGLLPE